MAHAQKPDSVFLRKGWVHLKRQWRQFSRVLAAEVCASAVVMLDTPCSELVWRVLATHSIRQFPPYFPSCAAPCAITFLLDSTHVQPSRYKNKRDLYCSHRCRVSIYIRYNPTPNYTLHVKCFGSWIWKIIVRAISVLIFIFSTSQAIYLWHRDTFVQTVLRWESNVYYIFWACICSLRYPACNAHAPYCHIWPCLL